VLKKCISRKEKYFKTLHFIGNDFESHTILAKQILNIFTFMRGLFIFHWHILVLKFRLILLHENFVSDVSHHNYENLFETLTEY